MNKQKSRAFLVVTLLFSFVAALNACASGNVSSEMAASSGEGAASTAASGEGQASAAASAAAPAAESAAVQVAAAEPTQDLSKVADIAAPPAIVESCKKEAFSKWEGQSRTAIKAGWEATKEQKYGIGFKNADEYKQWSETHNLVFKSISDACDDLSQCAKKHGKDKEKACAEQAATYHDWQELAKEFTDKVEAVKVTQLDDMCGIPLSLKDSRNCFESQSKNIAKHCQSEACDEVSQCWQSLAFMNDAFIQAETACKFSHIKLDKCRGYIEQEMRRKDQIESCEFMQKKLAIKFLPVL